MTTSVEPLVVTPPPAGRELRFVADQYEQAQSVRIQVGERIRAVVQGRDQTFALTEGTIVVEDPEDVATGRWITSAGLALDGDQVLAAIEKGETFGPVAILGRTYRRHHEEEREMFKEMGRALKAHPAYPWLSRVKGIGPTLACKLLARLDVTKAPYASSFWAFAGLATEPGKQYKCATCGLVMGFPLGHEVSGKHKVKGSGAACKGTLVEDTTATDVRVAQRRPARGEKAAYDQYLKKVMFLVESSFLKSPSTPTAPNPFEELYRAKRAWYDVERPGWADGRKHSSALRYTGKLFLSMLWKVWREALGMPTPHPWVVEHGGHDPEHQLDPWAMVQPERAPKIVRRKSA